MLTSTGSRCLAWLLVLGSAVPLEAQVLMREFVDPVVAPHRSFGSAVELGGGFVVIGAPKHSGLLPEPGQVYVFDAENGLLRHTLVRDPSSADADNFGHRLAVSEGHAIVGFQKAGSDSGACVFDLATGGLVRTFTGPHLATAVALDGRLAVLGSPFQGPRGQAHVVDVVSGEWLATLLPPAQVNSWFGYAVGISGQRVVVGTPDAGHPFGPAGGAWVFDATAGQLLLTLTPPDAHDWGFGSPVAVEGRTCIVGTGTEANTAHAIDLLTGAERHRWHSGSTHGESVALKRNIALVGEPGQVGGSSVPKVWIRDVESGALLGTILPPPSVTQNFGYAIAIDSGRALCGSRNLHPPNSVFLFGIPFEDSLFCFGDGSAAPCPCGNASASQEGAGCRHSGGQGGVLRWEGDPSLSGDSLVLRGAVLPNQPALYFQGASSHTPLTFGDGIKCTGGPFVRLVTRASPSGLTSYPTPGEVPVSVRGMVLQPGPRYYQLHYRDPASFCTPAAFNYSNAVRIDWIP